jgi:hypothetical protein
MKDDRPASVEEQLKLPAQEETDLVHIEWSRDTNSVDWTLG